MQCLYLRHNSFKGHYRLKFYRELYRVIRVQTIHYNTCSCKSAFRSVVITDSCTVKEMAVFQIYTTLFQYVINFDNEISLIFCILAAFRIFRIVSNGKMSVNTLCNDFVKLCNFFGFVCTVIRIAVFQTYSSHTCIYFDMTSYTLFRIL